MATTTRIYTVTDKDTGDARLVRAYRNRKGEVILEQSHFDAVTRGTFGAADRVKPAVNVAFLKRAA